MKYVKLFYRDGNNYKFSPTFEVEDELIEPFKTGEEVEYTDLGITREEFHEEIGYNYDPTTDHSIVEISIISEEVIH